MAQTGSFSQVLRTLEQQDFFIGVLPFLRSYVLFYATLKEVPIFDGEDDRFAQIISIVMGFFVSYIVVTTPAYQTFLPNYFATLTAGIVGVLGLFVILALTGTDDYYSKYFMGILALIIAGGAFTVSGGLGVFGLNSISGSSLGLLSSVLTYTLNTGLIWVVVILGAVAFASSGGSDSGGGGSSWDDVLKFFFNDSPGGDGNDQDGSSNG